MSKKVDSKFVVPKGTAPRGTTSQTHTQLGPRSLTGREATTHNTTVMNNTTVQSSVPMDEIEGILTYNDYLLANGKQLLLQRTIAQHTDVLDNQIKARSLQLHKLAETRKQIRTKTKHLEDIIRANKIADRCQNQVDQLQISNKEQVIKNLLQLLKEEANYVLFKNVASIDSKETFEQFVASVNNLNITLDKVLSVPKDIDKLNTLAGSLKAFEELYNAITKLLQEIDEKVTEAEFLFLKQASDFFAIKQGY